MTTPDTQDEWGPWIEHDGSGCPKEIIGMFGELLLHDALGLGRRTEGDRMVGVIYGSRDAWDWGYKPASIAKVCTYRIRKPRALTELQELIADVPEEVDA